MVNGSSTYAVWPCHEEIVLDQSRQRMPGAHQDLFDFICTLTFLGASPSSTD